MGNEEMMRSIANVAREATRKLGLRFAVFGLLALFIATPALVIRVSIQKNYAAIDSMTPYLIQLLKTNDIFDATRQLDSLVDSGTLSGFWLKEKVSGRILTQGSSIDGPRSPTRVKAGWWLEFSRGSIELYSSHLIIVEANTRHYRLVVSSPLPILTLVLIIVATMLLFLFAYWALDRQMMMLSDQIVAPIVGLSAFLGKVDAQRSEQLPLFPGTSISEVDQVYQQFSKLFTELNNAECARLQAERQAAVGSLAAQVAHDIRSPLAALDSVVNRLGQLPEQERVFMRSAINRIKDIANNLLQKNREIANSAIVKPEITPGEVPSIQLLSSLLDPLITEKRMQFRSMIGIEIDSRVDATSYGLFAKTQPTEFKRVISNLINNAVEALVGTGTIMLTVMGSVDEIEITVGDNGKGIPPEILAKLGQRGETHGKSGGSGLGLYHARTSVQSWGGKLRIESTQGAGTSVIITLPRAPSPSWFVSTLSLAPGTSVVVVDDDSSIHQVWQGRFDSLRVTEKQVEIVHLSTPDQFRDWVKANETKAHTAVYLVDYELLEFTETGLSLISELNLGKQSILVTSRFEERHILEGCQKLEVRLIPKGMAGFVPVEFAAKKEYFDAILIDDDELVHMSWAFAAKNAGKTVKSFSYPDQFFAVADKLEMSSPVYIDANLGAGIRGEVVAEKIFKMGFSNVYLATGYEAANYTQYTFLKGVLGKEPPF